MTAATGHTPANCAASAIPPAPTGWYVCVTKPRQENVAATHLREQGYEFYLPVLRQWARRAGAWQSKDTVMFPRYAFVRPGRPGQSVQPVRSTPGVTSLVRFGHVLAVMPEPHMDALRQVIDSASQAQPEAPLKAGQHVVFASGPLKGMEGIVSNVAATRVQVMMSLLGRQKAVAVPADQLMLKDPQP